METVTLSSKFQLVIPKKVRDGLGLKAGEKLVAIEKANSIEFVRISDIRKAKGFLKGISLKGLRDHSERFN